MKNNNFLLPLAFALAVIFGLWLGVLIAPGSGKPSLFNHGSGSDADEVLQFVQDNYVDTVNTGSLMQGGIQEMLSRLDPHSSFIPASNAKQFDEEIEGNFQGVGLRFSMVEDTIFIVEVVKDGPSEKTGILPGDRLVTANDTLMAGKKLTTDKVTKKLRGPSGSTVKLGMLRNGHDKLLYFSVTRGKVPVNSVDAAYMVTKDVGYIKLEMFSGNTYHEFKEAMDMLLAQGMKKLIFDLRGNGGGLLDEATSIIDEFIDQKKLMVYTKGRAFPREDYNTKYEGEFEKQPLALLIDEGSASASEIVAGALQDWDRADIIGRRSFGKGLVQNEFRLKDGSTLKLTIAKYYTPSGRCIQKPYNKNIGDYYSEVYQRVTDGELYNKDSIKINDTTRYHTASGRIVYGGGGIIPDIFVPKDSAKMNAFMKEVRESGLAELFVYSNFGRLIPQKKYKNIDELIADNIINDEVYNAFVKYCKLKGVKDAQRALTSAVRNYFVDLMKSDLAQMELGSSGFYQYENRNDKTLLKAVDDLAKK